MGRCLVFVYGLLKPGYHPPATTDQSWEDAVQGQLYDLGPYPAAVGLGQGDSWFEGYVCRIDESELARLDEFEGVSGDEGLYIRRQVTTRQGHAVWIYEYNRPIPAETRQIDRWEASSFPEAIG